jgi:hypothetical protein
MIGLVHKMWTLHCRSLCVDVIVSLSSGSQSFHTFQLPNYLAESDISYRGSALSVLVRVSFRSLLFGIHYCFTRDTRRHSSKFATTTKYWHVTTGRISQQTTLRKNFLSYHFNVQQTKRKLFMPVRKATWLLFIKFLSNAIYNIERGYLQY